MTLAPPSPTSGTELPTRLAVFYDPLSYAAYDHPYEVYRQLRDHAPVYYNARRDLWVVSRYEDVSACLRNHEQMINALGNDMDGTHASYGAGNLVAQDQPHHTVLRNVVRPSFAAREILAMEAHVRGHVRELLAKMREQGGGDFAQDIALPLVFGVSMRLMGAPAADSPFWQEHLMRSMARTVGQFGIPEDASRSNGEAEEHIAEVMRRRREQIAAGAPADTPDVISQILLAREKGAIEEAEVVGLAHLVLSASTDAPAALLTNCVAVLDKYPALQGYLRANPALVKNFVEETLRYDGPAKNLCRQTTAELDIAGVTIPTDSRVMVLMGSANRDERVYPEPDTFDLFRTFTGENKILTFGEGIHSCMGAPLARLTAQVAIEELVAALDGTEVRVVGTPERWAKQMVRGFARQPVQIVPVEHDLPVRAALVPTAHVEAVQHRSTRLTLATREFETAVRVVAKDDVAESVVALTLHDLDGHPLPPLGTRRPPRPDPRQRGDPPVLPLRRPRQTTTCGGWASCATPTAAADRVYVHDQLQTGDIVRIRGPRNNFPLVDSPRYLFIAGGIGITPILAMIRSAEAAGAQWRLRLRRPPARLHGLPRRARRLRRPGHRLAAGREGLHRPRRPARAAPPDTKVYCCGPEPLLNAVEQRCAAWPTGSLHVERFVAKPLTEPVLHEAFEVAPRPERLTLTVPPDTSILDAIERGRDRGAVLLRRRHLRHLRDTRARGHPRPPRLRARPGGTRRQRLHDDLRLPRLHPPPGPRPLSPGAAAGTDRTS